MSTQVAAQIDLSILLNTILGSIITIAGSLAVASLYIWNQNKNQRKRRLNDYIKMNYFEQGINPVVASLSEYGMITVFALADARKCLGRCLQFGKTNQEQLKAELEEISRRPILQDLTSHNFTNISKWLPALHKFGSAVHTSILRTLQLYSSLSADAVLYDNLMSSAKDSSADEVIRSLGAIAQIIDMTLSYLQKRFINLQDYVLTQDIKGYGDFLSLISQDKYKKFLSAMEQYKDGITKLMDAFVSPDNQARKDATLTVSKWLTDNMEQNPFA